MGVEAHSVSTPWLWSLHAEASAHASNSTPSCVHTTHASHKTAPDNEVKIAFIITRKERM